MPLRLPSWLIPCVLLLTVVACAPGPGEPGKTPPGPSIPPPAEAPAPTRGLDEALLTEAFERAGELRRLHTLLVARHGELAREQTYRGRGPDRPTNIKSASKSVISALVGIAIDEGHLRGLDQTVAPFFSESERRDADPRIAEITIGHLLSMQAGLDSTSFGNYGRWVSSRNWVRFALEQPMVDEPGGEMLYSTGSTHLLSAILTRATGKSTLAYAREKLGRPLGLDVSPWTRDPQGIYFGGNEMGLSPRDLLAFGELYRNDGLHEGEQVVSPAWVRESWRERTTSSWSGHGYGLGWWIRTSGAYDVFFAWGYGGQYVFVVPELELTVVTTSDSTSRRERGHNRSLHRLLDQWLVPAAEKGSGSPPTPTVPASEVGSTASKTGP